MIKIRYSMYVIDYLAIAQQSSQPTGYWTKRRTRKFKNKKSAFDFLAQLSDLPYQIDFEIIQDK